MMIAVIMIAMTLAGVTVALAVSASFRSVVRIGKPELMHVGDRTTLPASFFSASPVSLVVFSRSNCGACIALKPTLRRLVQAFDGRGQVRIVVPKKSPANLEMAFARELGLTPDKVTVEDEQLGITAMVAPTFVVLDCAGRIRYIAEGIAKTPAVIETDISKILHTALRCIP
jgi:thiol-disulfide isomerase/thioredoxin